MNSAGVTPRPLVQGWQFAVEADGFEPAYFLKAELPQVDFDEVEHNPAGSMFPQKAAGRAKFTDVTLEKSVPTGTADVALMTWLRQCITVTIASGGVPADYMRDIDIVLYDRAGVESRRYRMFGAWAKSAKFGSLDGSSSENIVEAITLSYQFFDRVR